MSSLTICPRCSNEMTCMPLDIEQCPCCSIHISEKLKTFLDKTNHNCLCPNCLEELETLVSQVESGDQNLSDKALKKGLHFYIENGNYVFTEYYHIQRGSCCENNCRHCAYGYGEVGR